MEEPLAVDRRPADRLRPADRQRSDAGNVQGLLAELCDTTHFDVFDRAGIDADSLDKGVQHLSGKLVGPERSKRPAAPADRRANRVDDECFRHEASLSRPLQQTSGASAMGPRRNRVGFGVSLPSRLARSGFVPTSRAARLV